MHFVLGSQDHHRFETLRIDKHEPRYYPPPITPAVYVYLSL